MAEFDQIFASDPNNPQNVAENGVLSIYAPGSRSLLSLKTVTGDPLSNPLQLNGRGFGPAFMVDGFTEVAWEAVAPGEVFTGTFKSYKGVLEETVAAKAAAQGALAAVPARIQEAVASGDFRGPAGKDGSNVVPTAQAIATELTPVRRLTDTGRGAVVLTIDDAYKFMRTLAEMMNARGQRGTFCVTPDLMNGTTKITDADILFISKSGHEIAAHSKTHANMSTLTNAQRAVEYDYPKTYLEGLIGAESVTTWAYPFGTGSNGRNAACDQQLYLRYDRWLDTATNTNPVIYPRYSDAPPLLINRTAWTDANHQAVLSTVRKAASSAVIVPLFFHDVNTALNPTIAQVVELLDLAQSLGVPLITTREAFPSVRSLLNAGFEGVGDPTNAVAPWRPFVGSSGTYSVVTDTPPNDYQGTKALKLKTTDNGFAYVRQQVQVVPGRQYTLSGQCRALAGPNLIADKCYVRVESLDYGQATIPGSQVKATVLLTADVGGPWKPFSLDYTAGQNAKTVNVDIALAGASGGGEVHFDHVWFEPKYLGNLG